MIPIDARILPVMGQGLSCVRLGSLIHLAERRQCDDGEVHVRIRKAVITAAGRGIRLYPAADTIQKAMAPIVDRDGLSKPVIQIIAEEALESGIEELCVVCAPGDEAQYVSRFQSLRENLLVAHKGSEWAQAQAERVSNLLVRLQFRVQEEALGYGHAVHCARSFVGDEPFLLLLSDHLYVSNVADKRCARQVMELAENQDCAVAAVHATREHLVGRYGTVSGKRVSDLAGAYQIERILEKPSVSVAESQLQTPGLRAGHFLCFFGMHVLTPALFDLLDAAITEARASQGEVQLTPALQALAEREKYLALEVAGRRYDIGGKFGVLQAQIALSMAGRDRDRVLATLTELLAESALLRDGEMGK